MLPKKYRLKINRTDSRKWGDKKQIYTPLLKTVFHFRKGAASGPTIGFIIPGKIKGSVKRNRVRRVLTEAVRERIEKFPNQIEAIVIANKEANEAKNEEVSNWVDKTLSKINTPAA